MDSIINSCHETIRVGQIYIVNKNSGEDQCVKREEKMVVKVVGISGKYIRWEYPNEAKPKDGEVVYRILIHIDRLYSPQVISRSFAPLQYYIDLLKKIC